MAIKTKTVITIPKVESLENQTLVLACSEQHVQLAQQIAINAIVEKPKRYTMRPVFGAVNCLAFNDRKNFVPTLDVIKKYIQHEGVNHIVIICHSCCAADKRANRSATVTESVQFQFKKANKAKQIILTALAGHCKELKVDVYVLVERKQFHLQKEVVPRAKKVAAAA